MFQDLRNAKKIHTAYIEVFDGEFVNDASFVFNAGCKFLKIPVVKFEHLEFGKLSFTKDDIVFGGVITMKRAINALTGLKIENFDIPECLKNYCKRDVRISTIRQELEGWTKPIFIKPTTAKLFPGQIVSCKEELDIFKHMDDDKKEDLEIFVSEVIKIKSEFRVFVLNGQAIDCRQYRGYFQNIIDFGVIDKIIKDFDGQPVAYSIDLGLTEDGETVLVEINDSYSLGPYGLDPYHYTSMIISRWLELMS